MHEPIRRKRYDNPSHTSWCTPECARQDSGKPKDCTCGGAQREADAANARKRRTTHRRRR